MRKKTELEVFLDKFFQPDGYCSCRCGAVHHELDADQRTGIISLFCKYHKVICGQLQVEVAT